jgi:hypothetical protein
VYLEYKSNDLQVFMIKEASTKVAYPRIKPNKIREEMEGIEMVKRRGRSNTKQETYKDGGGRVVSFRSIDAPQYKPDVVDTPICKTQPQATA